MPIVPLYASLLALLFVYLSLRSVRLRKRLRIALGDKGNPEMLRAMRVHANFAEYVPLSLLLIHFVERSAAPALLIHALAASLLIGRLVHAYGLSQSNEDFRLRVLSMALTFSALAGAALYLLAQALRTGFA